METADNLIDYLRFKGFQEVDVKIEDEDSYWWKYPLMAGTGLAGGSLATYYVLRMSKGMGKGPLSWAALSFMMVGLSFILPGGFVQVNGIGEKMVFLVKFTFNEGMEI